MKCSKCGTKYNSDVKYCVRCGYLFPSNDVERLTNDSVDGFIEVYFRNSEVRFHIHRICIPYIFFPISYPLLKGMWYEAINSLLVLLWNLIMIPLVLKYSGPFGIMFCLVSILFSFAYYFYNVFKFNDKRIEDAFYRVNRIRRDNPKASVEELYELMREDAKNHVLIFALSIPAVIFLLIFIGIML